MHQYHVICGGVMYDIYVIYRLYVFTHCMSFYSFHTDEHTYTSPAINNKLVFSVSVGSTVTSGAPLLFTSAQLRPSCGRL